jgi:hypothetical protein
MNACEMKRPTKPELERALKAACVLAFGRACFRTHGGVPMGLPMQAERIVRDALLRLDDTSSGEQE